MKKLIYFALASATTLQLAGCGPTDAPELDKYNMGDGYTATTALGGYWWTYVDRSGTSFVDPNTGKKAPTDALATELRPGIALGNGIEEVNGNLAYHVRGWVGSEPNYNEANANYDKFGDPYWDTLFGDLCKDGICGEIKYPSSGIGWGFKDKNDPLGADATDKNGKMVRGIAFRLMLGPEHGEANGALAPLGIAAPMDITDVPDPSFGDKFGSAYDTETAKTLGLRTSPNAPFCTFPNTVLPNGKKQVSGKKTCFGNMKAQLDPQPVKGAFTSYCVEFGAFTKPDFGSLGSKDHPLGMIKKVMPQRLIKVQFEAYQPAESEAATAFDFYVDDAMLLTEELWSQVCTGPNVKIMADPDAGAAATEG